MSAGPAGLYRSEVLRLTSRRLVRIAGLLFLGLLLVAQVVSAARSRDGGEAYRQAEAEARQSQQQGVAMCESLKASGDIPSEVACESAGGELYVDDPRYRADEMLPELPTALAVAASLLAFLVGASYVGADWHAGTMQSLLFWEPRRQRVVLVKALALVTVLVAFTVFIQLVGWATTMLAASTRGTTEGVTSGMHQSAFLTMLRGMVVVSFSGLLGYAVAGLARVTAAALGGAFVYFAIVENLVRGFRPGWVRYLVTENVTAVLQQGTNVPTARARNFTDYFGETWFRLTGVRGAVTLGVYLVLLVGVFALAFSRRDVT